MKYLKYVILVNIFFVLFSTNVIAQNSTLQENYSGTIPVLNNHKFVLNPFVKSPFITTNIRNTLGFGEAVGLEVPIIEIGESHLVGLRGSLLFINLAFEYQYAVNDWLGMFAKFGVTSRLGDNAQTLLAQGMNATTELELGWLIKLYQSEKIMLSTTLNLWNSNGTLVNLFDFVKGVVDSGGFTPGNKMVISRNFIVGGFGFRLAWAPSKLFGVSLLSEFAYGESVDRRNSNKLYYTVAASTDFDLLNVSDVPIGFALGFKINSFISGSDTTIDGLVPQLFLRTSYTGRDNFLISLDLTYLNIKLKNKNESLNSTGMKINMEYFF
ncbi:MAG: hypothetical protein L3J41_14650 [Melioribacteraceae bacterium]|nr:hypothetical protein [Melioribacteraceae bacterium]